MDKLERLRLVFRKKIPKHMAGVQEPESDRSIRKGRSNKSKYFNGKIEKR